ncbi:MAG TPA: hypothetical protein EYP36_09585 [Calditrichaeota bacterium]|nr:hypothetical protein [Calditrichota bacterium]
MKNASHKIGIGFVFMVLSIQFAKSPLPPPYYRFYASGHMKGDSLTDRENFAVQLFGLNDEYYPLYKPLSGMYNEAERPVALTDSNGYFFIMVNNPYFCDSLKVGIVQP